MRVCILEADRPEGKFLAEHGSYAAMFPRWLGPVMPDAEFEILDVVGGATYPDDVATYDGYLITGARAGVYDDEPWIVPLIAFLRPLRALALKGPWTAQGWRVQLPTFCVRHRSMTTSEKVIALFRFGVPKSSFAAAYQPTQLKAGPWKRTAHLFTSVEKIQ